MWSFISLFVYIVLRYFQACVVCELFIVSKIITNGCFTFKTIKSGHTLKPAQFCDPFMVIFLIGFGLLTISVKMLQRFKLFRMAMSFYAISDLRPYQNIHFKQMCAIGSYGHFHYIGNKIIFILKHVKDAQPVDIVFTPS